MKNATLRIGLFAFTLGLFTAPRSQAQTLPLLAVGTLDQSLTGSFADLSGLTYTLENGVPANSLGGFGSAICYASGNTFLALPDRGPNAMPYDSNIDDTNSYINRFHTVTTPGLTRKACASRTTVCGCTSPTSMVLMYMSSTASSVCACVPSNCLTLFT